MPVLPTHSPSSSGRPAPRDSSRAADIPAATDTITLTAGALCLGVFPELGASIAYFRSGDISILRETPPEAFAARDGRAFSGFPLIPFSNRIRAARFSFAGKHYVIARDAEDPRHALHGTSRFYPWQVTARTENSLRCAIDYTPQNFDWPFAYQAWQEFTLTEDRLRVSIGLRNTHNTPAPAGIGLHPYFSRVPGMELAFDAQSVWAKDSQDIPTQKIPDDGRYNFDRRHAIDDGLIDNDYGGWGGRIDIFAPERPDISIQASKSFSELVLFTPVGKPYLAAEPVSHRPDAIHGGDMTVLQPGETLAGVIEIVIT
jgi:aldose 1-epimerase